MTIEQVKKAKTYRDTYIGFVSFLDDKGYSIAKVSGRKTVKEARAILIDHINGKTSWRVKIENGKERLKYL